MTNQIHKPRRSLVRSGELQCCHNKPGSEAQRPSLCFDTHFCQQMEPPVLPPSRYWVNISGTPTDLPLLILVLVLGHHIILRLVSIYLQIVSFYLLLLVLPVPPCLFGVFSEIYSWWHIFDSCPRRTPDMVKLCLFWDSINFMLRCRLCKTVTPPPRLTGFPLVSVNMSPENHKVQRKDCRKACSAQSGSEAIQNKQKLVATWLTGG